MASINDINGRSGQIVQMFYTTSNSTTSTTTALSPANTPTTANTVFLTSVTFAPKNSNNILLFDFSGCIDTGSNGSSVSFFLFQASTLLVSFIQLGSIVTLSTGSHASLLYSTAAGTTSSTTFSIYYSSSSTGTSYINQERKGGTYNSTMRYLFSVTEVLG